MATKKSKKRTAAPARTAKKSTRKAAPARASSKKTSKRAAAKGSKAKVHPVVHWEIQSVDPTRLHDFYAQAFGWKIDANNPMKYGMVASKGKAGIAGGIGGTEANESRVLVYTSVPSIVDLLDRIESLGGKTRMPRTDIGPVIMALYEDPEGNVMGLIED